MRVEGHAPKPQIQERDGEFLQLLAIGSHAQADTWSDAAPSHGGSQPGGQPDAPDPAVLVSATANAALVADHATSDGPATLAIVVDTTEVVGSDDCIAWVVEAA